MNNIKYLLKWLNQLGLIRIESIFHRNFALTNYRCRSISYENSWQILFSPFFKSIPSIEKKKLERIKREYCSLCCLLLIAMMASIHKLLSIQLCGVVVGARVLNFTETTRWVSQTVEECAIFHGFLFAVKCLFLNRKILLVDFVVVAFSKE